MLACGYLVECVGCTRGCRFGVRGGGITVRWMLRFLFWGRLVFSFKDMVTVFAGLRPWEPLVGFGWLVRV